MRTSYKVVLLQKERYRLTKKKLIGFMGKRKISVHRLKKEKSGAYVAHFCFNPKKVSTKRFIDILEKHKLHVGIERHEEKCRICKK